MLWWVQYLSTIIEQNGVLEEDIRKSQLMFNIWRQLEKINNKNPCFVVLDLLKLLSIIVKVLLYHLFLLLYFYFIRNGSFSILSIRSKMVMMIMTWWWFYFILLKCNDVVMIKTILSQIFSTYRSTKKKHILLISYCLSKIRHFTNHAGRLAVPWLSISNKESRLYDQVCEECSSYDLV